MSYSPGSLLLFPMTGLRCRWATGPRLVGRLPYVQRSGMSNFTSVDPRCSTVKRPWKTGADFVKIWVKNNGIFHGMENGIHLGSMGI